MMPSSSQVHDHQLIFQIFSGVRQFHHWQKREERSRSSRSSRSSIEERREQYKRATVACQNKKESSYCLPKLKRDYLLLAKIKIEQPQ